MTFLNIEETEFNRMKKAQRRGRVRSRETQELIDAINSLVPGVAKAVVVGPGQTSQKVRARVMYAGKAAGKSLQAAVSGNKVLFALKDSASEIDQTDEINSEP
jgi:hypothetical protein